MTRLFDASLFSPLSTFVLLSHIRRNGSTADGDTFWPAFLPVFSMLWQATFARSLPPEEEWIPWRYMHVLYR